MDSPQHAVTSFLKCNKIQDGGRPPFWKKENVHNSATVWDIFTKFGMLVAIDSSLSCSNIFILYITEVQSTDVQYIGEEMLVSLFIRPPGTLVPKALCFTRDVFFLFLSPGYLRAASADRRETLPHDRYLGALYNASPKIRGALPPKKWGQKTQNLGQFQTTSDFDREYLRNGTRYSKSERRDNQRFLPRSTKKVLWTLVTNYRELYVSLNPPKLHFFARLYFSP